jgi:hypothetical protein
MAESFTGDPGGYVEKVLETGISLHRAPLGNLEGGSFIGTFKRKRNCISSFRFFDPEDTKS